MSENRSKGQKSSVRTEKLIEGVIQGKSPPEAARDAGFSESYARVDVYRRLANPSIQARIQARIAESQVESNEIIGTLASHMRSDLADLDPDNEILQKAKENGVSHLIKKLRQRERFISNGPGREPDREVITEIELYSAQEAAKQLASILGIVKQPALNPIDVEEIFARLRLAEFYKEVSDAELRVVVAQSLINIGIDDKGQIG